jgi:hypothetical protein
MKALAAVRTAREKARPCGSQVGAKTNQVEMKGRVKRAAGSRDGSPLEPINEPLFAVPA